MPEWLQITQVIVGTAFVVGTVLRGGSMWVFNHTIKRDIKDLGDGVKRDIKDLTNDFISLKERVDRYNGSDIWGEVETKVGGIEVEQKLLKQRVDYLQDRLNALNGDVTAERNRRDERRPR